MITYSFRVRNTLFFGSWPHSSGQDTRVRVRIDAGAVLSAMMVRDTPEEMALKAGSPALITIGKNPTRMIGQ